MLAAIIKEPNQKTPPEFIKRREDGYFYVEIGYVKRRLNQLFTPLCWSHTTIEIGTIDDWLKIGQVAVKVELKVKLPYNKGWLEITKNGYGGVPIKRLRKDNSIMDFANDLKSAEADGLKKAASNFGIADDIFHPQVRIDTQKAYQRQIGNRENAMRGIFACARELWNLSDKEEIKKKIKEFCNIEVQSFSEATEAVLVEIFNRLQILKQEGR